MIKELLTDLQNTVPVIWDRYTKNGDDYSIYGWIERKDGKRDFVLLELHKGDNDIKGGMVTSSAKYSQIIHEFMFKTKEGHVSCQKIETLV